MQENTRARMGNRLFVQVGAKMAKQGVEPRRVDDGPWNDLDAPSVKSRYEVLILFFLYNLLEFERKSTLIKVRFKVTEH